MVLALALAGCATVWQHPTKSADDYDHDYYECERDAAPQADAFMWRGMMERCLRVKGWREK